MTHNPYEPPESQLAGTFPRPGDAATAAQKVLIWGSLSVGGGVVAGWISATYVYSQKIEHSLSLAINGFIFGLCLAVGIRAFGGFTAAKKRHVALSGVSIRFLLLVLTCSMSFAASGAFPPRSLILQWYYTQPWLFAFTVLILPTVLRLVPIALFVIHGRLLSTRHAVWFLLTGLCLEGIYPLVLDGYLGFLLLPLLSHAILLCLLAGWLRLSPHDAEVKY